MDSLNDYLSIKTFICKPNDRSSALAANNRKLAAPLAPVVRDTYEVTIQKLENKRKPTVEYASLCSITLLSTSKNTKEIRLNIST